MEEEKTQELVVIDINRYRQVKHALQKSEMQYQELFESVPIALFQTDQDFKLLRVNRLFQEIFPHCSEHPQCLLEVLRPVSSKIKSEGALLGWETEYSSPSGITSYLRFNINQKESEGKIFYSGSIEDITEKVLISNKLKLERDKLSFVLENAPYGIFISDQQDRIIFFNKIFQSIVGVDEEKIYGKNFADIFQISQAELKLIKYYQLKIPPEEIQIEAIIRPPEKSRLKFLSTRLSNHTEIYFFTDISREFNRERAINFLNQLILTGNRFEELDPLLELIFNVASRLTDFEKGAILLRDSKPNDFQLRYERDFLQDHFLKNYNENLKKREIRNALFIEKKAIFSDEFTIQLQNTPDNSLIKFICYIPLLCADELIGTLILLSENRSLLSEDEKRFLITIGREGGTLIKRLLSEKSLRKKEEIYRKTFNFIPDFAFLLCLTPEGNLQLLAANDLAMRKLKNHIKGLLGKTVEAIFADQPKNINELYEAFFQKSLRRQLQFEFKPGFPRFWLDIYAVCISDNELLIIVRDITGQKEREKELNQYQQKLRKLSLDLTLLEERERKQISRELHDGLAQNLALCKLLLSDQKTNHGQEKKELQKIRQLIQESIDITRSLIFDLSPPILYELGINRAMEWLAEKIAEKFGFKVTLELKSELKLNTENRYLIFKSIQELLNNCGRHSGASKVQINVQEDDRHYLISVADNGCGFDPQQLKTTSSEHFGLFNINERISFIGGKMEIISAKDQGTKITLFVPIQNEG